MLIFISSFIATVDCWPTFSSLSSVDNRKEERVVKLMFLRMEYD